MDPFEKFQRQVDGTLQMLRYLLLMQETFPHVMLQLTPNQTRRISKQTVHWIEFSREIYKMPELGCDPPRPIPIDPNCPPHLLSDEIKKCLGKNHAFFATLAFASWRIGLGLLAIPVLIAFSRMYVGAHPLSDVIAAAAIGALAASFISHSRRLQVANRESEIEIAPLTICASTFFLEPIWGIMDFCEAET